MRSPKIIAVFGALALFLFAPNLHSDAPAASDADQRVIAEFTGGRITRGEFREVMKFRFKGRIPAHPEARRSYLRRYAVVRIMANRGRRDKLLSTTKYIRKSALLPELVRLELYRRYLLTLPPRRTYRFIRMQLLILRVRRKPPGGAGKKTPDDLAKKARGITQALNRPGLSVTASEALIARHTKSLRYRASAGFISPQCMNCGHNPNSTLTNWISKAPPGRFMYQRNEYGHVIARRVSVDSVRSENLMKYFIDFYIQQALIVKRNINGIKDQQQRAKARRIFPKDGEAIRGLARRHQIHFTNKERRGRLRARIRRLLKARGLIVHKQAPSPTAASYKDTTPLFTLSGRIYTYSQLKKRLPSPHFDEKARLIRLQTILTDRILRGTLTYDRVSRSRHYEAVLKYARTAALGRVYGFKAIPATRPISELAIRSEYEKYKATRFSGRRFDQVRSIIEARLHEKAYRKAKKKFVDRVIRESKLKILVAAP